jgi:hypothetical protein
MKKTFTGLGVMLSALLVIGVLGAIFGGDENARPYGGVGRRTYPIPVSAAACGHAQPSSIGECKASAANHEPPVEKALSVTSDELAAAYQANAVAAKNIRKSP